MALFRRISNLHMHDILQISPDVTVSTTDPSAVSFTGLHSDELFMRHSDELFMRPRFRRIAYSNPEMLKSQTWKTILHNHIAVSWVMEFRFR